MLTSAVMRAGQLQESLESLEPGMVAVLGLPTDEASSYLRGVAGAPPKIRQALASPSTNRSSESGLDLGDEPRLRDLGDLELSAGAPGREAIRQSVAGVLERGARVLSLGGDHAVTYPILQAYGARFENLEVLHLDAHPDLYDELEGNRFSHACPFARAMEEGLAARLVQVGIRTLNPHQRRQAERFGVEIHDMMRWPPAEPLAFTGPLYVSLDLDVLDPAFAPGVSHHEPGGFSVREVLRILHGLTVPIVGADIVELNPERDPSGVTARVAAKFFKEIAAHMLTVG